MADTIIHTPQGDVLSSQYKSGMTADEVAAIVKQNKTTGVIASAAAAANKTGTIDITKNLGNPIPEVGTSNEKGQIWTGSGWTDISTASAAGINRNTLVQNTITGKIDDTSKVNVTFETPPAGPAADTTNAQLKSLVDSGATLSTISDYLKNNPEAARGAYASWVQSQMQTQFYRASKLTGSDQFKAYQDLGVYDPGDQAVVDDNGELVGVIKEDVWNSLDSKYQAIFKEQGYIAMQAAIRADYDTAVKLQLAENESNRKIADAITPYTGADGKIDFIAFVQGTTDSNIKVKVLQIYGYTAGEIAQLIATARDTVKTDYGEYINKSYYDSLSDVDKASINKLGVSEFNIQKQMEIINRLDGEYLDAYLTGGVDKLNALVEKQNAALQELDSVKTKITTGPTKQADITAADLKNATVLGYASSDKTQYSYDIAKYLRTGGSEQTVLDAGFSDEAITEAKQYNYYVYGVGVPDKSSQPTETEFIKQYFADNGWEIKTLSLEESADRKLTADFKAKVNEARDAYADQYLPHVTMTQYIQNYHEMKGWELPEQQEGESLKDYNARVSADETYHAHYTEALNDYKSKYGEGAVVGSYVAPVASMLFLPAKALAAEVRAKDVTGLEWAVGAAQIALILSPIKVPVTTSGKIASTGLQAVATGVFIADTAVNWQNMSPGERTFAVAINTVIAATVVHGAGVKIIPDRVLNAAGIGDAGTRAAAKAEFNNMVKAMNAGDAKAVATSAVKYREIINNSMLSKWAKKEIVDGMNTVVKNAQVYADLRGKLNTLSSAAKARIIETAKELHTSQSGYFRYNTTVVERSIRSELSSAEKSELDTLISKNLKSETMTKEQTARMDDLLRKGTGQDSQTLTANELAQIRRVLRGGYLDMETIAKLETGRQKSRTSVRELPSELKDIKNVSYDELLQMSRQYENEADFIKAAKKLDEQRQALNDIVAGYDKAKQEQLSKELDDIDRLSKEMGGDVEESKTLYDRQASEEREISRTQAEAETAQREAFKQAKLDAEALEKELAEYDERLAKQAAWEKEKAEIEANERKWAAARRANEINAAKKDNRIVVRYADNKTLLFPVPSTKTKRQTLLETILKTQPETVTLANTQLVTQTLTETKTQTDTETKTALKLQTQTKTQTAAKTAVETQTKTATDTATKTEVKTNALTDTDLTTKITPPEEPAPPTEKYPQPEEPTPPPKEPPPEKIREEANVDDTSSEATGYEGAVGWKQGKLHDKPVVRILKPPYKKSEVRVGDPPAGVAIVSGPGSASKSIAVLSGEAPKKEITADIGAFIATVTPLSRRKVEIKFAEDGENKPKRKKQKSKNTSKKYRTQKLGSGVVETRTRKGIKRHLSLY